MRKAIAFLASWAFVSGILLANALYALADERASQKLETIVIPDHHLEGTPKENARQLNKLAKKYDFPKHEGIVIRFDPAVDAENCSVTSRHDTKPLGSWLQ